MEMPNPGLDSAREIVRAVEDGTLLAEAVDARVDELLDAVLYLTEQAKSKKTSFDEKAHHGLARRAAAESAVLLKNEDNILPLPARTKVALIGDFAAKPRYQGAGSSVVNAIHVESMDKIIQNYDLQTVGMARGYIRTGEADAALQKEALDIARNADAVLYCFGLDEISESEGMDRAHMRIPQNQIELLEALVKVNENVIGILSAGSAIEMPWQNSCKAILHGFLSGEAGASAILDLITGKENPSGRLSESYPIRYEDTPAYRYFPSTERTAEYRESIYVGYRYYDTSRVRVQYPFGFGLSYTEFTYSDLKISEKGISLTVENTGKYDGAEVVQLYVGLHNAIVFRPEKELKGFKKVYLKAGESRIVEIPFDDKTFRYWNVKTDQWEIEMGDYDIMAGASVSDIRLRGKLHVEGTTDIYPYNPAQLPYYYTGLVQSIHDDEFRNLLGHGIPSGKWSGEIGPNDAICQMFYAKSALARLVYNRLTAMKKKSEEAGKPDLNILFIYNMPFRGIAKMTGGMVSREMVEGMLSIVNGHFFRGAGRVIGGFFRNRKANKEYEAKLGKKR